MEYDQMFEAAEAAGGPIERAVAIFMLHPETLAESVAAGYENPWAGYTAGRGGALGEPTGAVVGSAFVVFEPDYLDRLWREGIAVHGASAAAAIYWEQLAGFARRYLTGADGLDRIVELGEKIIAVAPTAALPLYAAWRTVPRAEDTPARALQVMYVLRELRAGVHFNALTNSGITPVEAHMLNKGYEYTTIFGWPEPFADGAGQADLYAEVEEATDRRMAQILSSALQPAEADDLAAASAAALKALVANVPD